jgi:hypothetical protein
MTTSALQHFKGSEDHPVNGIKFIRMRIEGRNNHEDSKHCLPSDLTMNIHKALVFMNVD